MMNTVDDEAGAPSLLEPVAEPSDSLKTIESQEPVERAEPIENRFLFVDVAAQRAKQLRRGALPRLGKSGDEAVSPQKLERMAMQEVSRGMVHYSLPDPDDVQVSKTKTEEGE